MKRRELVNTALRKLQIAKLPDHLWSGIDAYTAPYRANMKVSREAVASYLRHKYSNYDIISTYAAFSQDEIDIIRANVSDRVMVRFDAWLRTHPRYRKLMLDK